MLVSVFEHFTEHARVVVVLAQKEARQLRHNYIGAHYSGQDYGSADSAVMARARARRTRRSDDEVDSSETRLWRIAPNANLEGVTG
jgi:hypothetical protein